MSNEFEQHELNDLSKMFDVLDAFCYEIIADSYNPLKLFKRYKIMIETSRASHDDRLLGMTRFFDNCFYDVFPEEYARLAKLKKVADLGHKSKPIKSGFTHYQPSKARND